MELVGKPTAYSAQDAVEVAVHTAEGKDAQLVCFTSKKRGHFEEHCFFMKMGKATTIEVCLDGAFLDAVGTNTEKYCMASVLLEN